MSELVMSKKPMTPTTPHYNYYYSHFYTYGLFVTTAVYRSYSDAHVIIIIVKEHINVILFWYKIVIIQTIRARSGGSNGGDS